MGIIIATCVVSYRGKAVGICMFERESTADVQRAMRRFSCVLKSFMHVLFSIYSKSIGLSRYTRNEVPLFSTHVGI